MLSLTTSSSSQPCLYSEEQLGDTYNYSQPGLAIENGLLIDTSRYHMHRSVNYHHSVSILQFLENDQMHVIAHLLYIAKTKEK